MAKKTVLLADDMEEIRDNIMMILGEDKYDWKTAETGDGALKILMSTPVDLIISDIAMPGGNGLDLIKACQNLKNPPKTILVTGYATLFDDPSARPDATIEKPFTEEDLKATVNKLIGQ